MDSQDPPPDNHDIKSRLLAADGIIKQLRLDLAQSLELIAQLREHCDEVKSKLSVAEREHAFLLKEVERL